MGAGKTMEFSVAPVVIALAQAGLTMMPAAAHAAYMPVGRDAVMPDRESPSGVYVAQLKYPPGYGPKVDSAGPQGDTSGKDVAPPTKGGSSSSESSGARRPGTSGSSGTGGR